jgi:hypothetical protein
MDGNLVDDQMAHGPLELENLYSQSDFYVLGNLCPTGGADQFWVDINRRGFLLPISANRKRFTIVFKRIPTSGQL